MILCEVRSSPCAAEVSGCSGSPVFSSVCQNLSLRRPQIQRDTAMSHIPAGSAPSPRPPLPQHLSGCFSLRHTCSVPLPDALNRAPLFSSSTEDGSLLDAESVTCKFMSRRGMDGPDSCGGNVRSARWTRCRSLPASEDFTNSGRKMDHAQTNKMYEIKSHLGFAFNTSSIT